MRLQVVVYGVYDADGAVFFRLKKRQIPLCMQWKPICWIYQWCKFHHADFGLNQPREWLDPCKYAHCRFTILFCISCFLLQSTPFTPSSLPHQAISGQAVDRHLNGLKLIAAEAGMETPSLFKDVAYTRSVSQTLFSSNVCTVVKVLVATSLTTQIRALLEVQKNIFSFCVHSLVNARNLLPC